MERIFSHFMKFAGLMEPGTRETGQKRARKREAPKRRDAANQPSGDRTFEGGGWFWRIFGEARQPWVVRSSAEFREWLVGMTRRKGSKSPSAMRPGHGNRQGGRFVSGYLCRDFLRKFEDLRTNPEKRIEIVAPGLERASERREVRIGNLHVE